VIDAFACALLSVTLRRFWQGSIDWIKR